MDTLKCGRTKLTSGSMQYSYTFYFLIPLFIYFHLLQRPKALHSYANLLLTHSFHRHPRLILTLEETKFACYAICVLILTPDIGTEMKCSICTIAVEMRLKNSLVKLDGNGARGPHFATWYVTHT